MSDPDGVMLDPERIAARIVEDIHVPVYLQRHEMLERVAAILREELAGPERPWPTRDSIAVAAYEANEKKRAELEGGSLEPWTPWSHQTSSRERQVAYAMADAILALFPAPDARLLADFRWLAGKFVYEDGAGRRSTGSDVEIELREWQDHVTPHLEEPRR